MSTAWPAITEGANGFPGAARPHPRGVRDDRANFAGRRLEHVLAGQEPQRRRAGRRRRARAASYGRFSQGFDRFYGFIGGETNQWYPDLVEDNHFIDQPYCPEEGYHLSKDSSRPSHQMIRTRKPSNPSKPWYMWFCPGANHAPHHCPAGTTSTNTRASLTTAMTPTASGSCRA